MLYDDLETVKLHEFETALTEELAKMKEIISSKTHEKDVITQLCPLVKIKFSEEDRQGLIDLIVWYRDEYHKNDFGHTKMIEAIKTAENLEPFYKTVDSWLE